MRKESKGDGKAGKGQLEECNNGQNRNRDEDKPHVLSRRLFFLTPCFLVMFSLKDQYSGYIIVFCTDIENCTTWVYI